MDLSKLKIGALLYFTAYLCPWYRIGMNNTDSGLPLFRHSSLLENKV
jgi:hypothetical protein